MQVPFVATEQDKKQRHSAHQTQWAAQFAVASELCKRGYEVALTMGNHPMDRHPLPGTPEAKALGCTCEVVIGPDGKPVYAPTKGCPIRNHG